MRNTLLLLVAMLAAGTANSPAADEGTAAPPPIVVEKDGQKVTNEPATSNRDQFVAPRSIEELTGAATPTDPPVVTPAVPAVDWEPIVQAMQLMIDQQKLALQSMDQARADTVANSKRESDATADRMTKLQEAIEAQRTHEAETINRMNRLVVGVAAGFAGTGFVVMILTAWFFMRTMNRVAEINANIQSQLLALPHSQPQLVGSGSTPQAGNQRLLGALEQLERRIRELEHTAAPGGVSPGSGFVNASAPAHATSAAAEAELVDLERGEEEPTPSSGALMAKGQTLLNLDDAEQALACFDAVLKKEPRNADALLKKGTALERLRRMHEALDAYDAALQEDDSLTMAYLAKGGICNKLERYAEALECYERALRVQQHATV